MAINWDKIYKNAEKVDKKMAANSLPTKSTPQPQVTAKIKGTFAGDTPQMQANAQAQIDRNRANKEAMNSLKAKAQPLTFDERVATINAFGGNSASTETREKADLYRAATSPAYRFASGVAEGLSPLARGQAQTEYGKNAQALREASALSKVGNLAGEMASFAIPYAGASGKIGAAVEKLPAVAKLSKTGQAVAKSVATDLAVGLPLNTNYAINKEGKTGAEAIKSIATNTAIDLALGGAMEALGGMLKRSAKQAIPVEEVEQVLLALPAPAEKDLIMAEIKAKGGATQKDIQKLADLVNAEKSKAIPIEDVTPFVEQSALPIPTKSVSETVSETAELPKKNLGYALGADNSRVDTLEGYGKTYGTFEGTPIPKATPYGETSQAAATMWKGVGEDGKRVVEEATSDGTLAKFLQTNETTVNKATERFDNLGYEESKEAFTKAANGRMKAEDLALGFKLMREAEARGDKEALYSLVAEVTEAASSIGRSLQAMTILKRLSPEGRLMTAESIARKLGDKTGKKLTVSDDIKKKLTNAKTEGEIAKVNKELAIELWNQIPPTLTEKLDAWRYTAMLFNPKTHIRNITGNFVFGLLKNTKNAIGTGIESLVKPEVRTKAILTTKDKALKNYAKEAWDKLGKMEYTAETKFSDAHRPTEAKLYNNKVLEKIRRLSGDTLEAEDIAFGKYHYQDAFAQYMKANNIKPQNITDELFAEINNYAMQEAEKATFRNKNTISTGISKAKRKLQSPEAGMAGKVGNFLLASTIPFSKTPINILARGIDYSPLGFAKAIFDANALKKGTKTANDVIDDVATAITGTALLGTGAALYLQDNLTAKKDYDKKGMHDTMTGEQGWALNFDGNTYTIDSLVPASMPLLVGAELAAAIKKSNSDISEAEIMDIVLDSLSKISDPLIETSMLKGLNDTLEAGASDSVLPSIFGKAGQNLASQFVPTLGGQVARTLTNERKSYTSTEKTSWKRGLEKFGKKIQGKVPVLSDKLEPYVDQWGRTEAAGPKNPVANAAYQFLSPGYYKSANNTPVDNEIKRLAKALPNDDAMYPSISATYDVKQGETTYRMSNSDWTQYQKTAGQYKYKELEKLIKTQGYKSASDAEKLSMVEDVYKEGNTLAKAEFLVSQGVSPKNAYSEGLSKTELEGQEISGLSPKAYRDKVIEIKGKTKELGTDRAGVKAMVIASGNYGENMANALGIDEAQQSAAQQLINAGWTAEDLIDVIDNAGSKKAEVTAYLRAYPSRPNDATIRQFYKLINKGWSDKIK